MSWVIIVGNPCDGFQLIGPFGTASEAIHHAEENVPSRESWWVTGMKEGVE